MMRRAILAVILCLSCAVPVAAQSSTPKRPNWWRPAVVFVGAQAADAWSTCAALTRAGVREANPILGDHPACGDVVLMKAVVTLPILAMIRERPKETRTAVYVASAILAAVAVHNVRVMRRAER